MKKLFAVIIAAITLLSLLAGCVEVNVEVKRKEKEQEQEPTETATAPAGSGISCEEVLDNFREKLEPLADQFKMTLGLTTELDSGLSCQSVTVSYTTVNDRYDISIYYTQAGEVDTVAIVAERGKYTDVTFALLSYYLYDSLNTPEMEADAFYEQFKLLTTEPEGFLFLDEWYVSASTLDTLLMFSVSFDS